MTDLLTNQLTNKKYEALPDVRHQSNLNLNESLEHLKLGLKPLEYLQKNCFKLILTPKRRFFQRHLS